MCLNHELRSHLTAHNVEQSARQDITTSELAQDLRVEAASSDSVIHDKYINYTIIYRQYL